MAFFRTKFQIFDLVISDNYNYNLFLRHQTWHSARPIFCSRKNVNENCYDDEESSPLTSKDYGKTKKMRFLNFRKTSSMRTGERSRIINCKTLKTPGQKLKFWEYVFGLKKSLSDSCRLVHQKQMHLKETPRLYDTRYQTTIKNVIYREPIKSLKNPKNLKQQPMYKVPRSVLLNRMIMDGFDEKINCENKTITFAAIRKPYEEMKPPSNFRKVVDLRRDVRSEGNEKSMPQTSTRINTIEVPDSTTKISRQENPQKYSRIVQSETLVNKKMSEFKRE